MRALAPENEDIVIVGDGSETHRAIEAELRAELRAFPEISATVISTDRIEELIARLKAQRARYMFLTTLGKLASSQTRALMLRTSIGEIIASGEYVVFSMEDIYLKPGVLGGWVTSGPRQGRAAAMLLRRHIEGTALEALPPIETSPNEYLFDARELARAGLTLPPDIRNRAILLNVAPTFYESNRGLVLGMLYTLGALLVLGLAAALWMFARKNRLLMHASRDLAESERLLSAIVENEPECVKLLDRQGGLLRMNRAGLDMIEAETEAQVLGHQVAGIVVPEHRKAFMALGQKVFGGGSGTLEFEIQGLKGGRRWLETHAVPLRDATGEITRLLGVTRDITERKALERSLRDSEMRANQIIEHSPNAMLVVDAAGRIQRMNGRAKTLFGYARTELIGQSVDVLVPDPLRERHRRGMEGYMQHPGLVNLGRDHDVLAMRKDGSTFPVDITLAPMRENGELQVIVSLADISERKALEDELRSHRDRLEDMVAARTAELEAARSEAERLMRVKSEFLANMSHEIRTPLNAVLGLARMGARDCAGQPSGETFGRIMGAGSHLLGVINDILDISKFEAGKLAIEKRPFQLAAVLSNATSFVADAAGQKGLLYEMEAADDLPAWVSGDAMRVQQILANLLSNAVKFTARGEVRLRVAREGDNVFFKVIDSGIGLTEEQRGRLFTAFEQADTSTTRKYGGSGLGLAISRNLARMMGGDISVDSAPDHGSAFTLCLPLPAVEPLIARAPDTRLPAGPRLRHVRVLAAEDMEVNRLILEDLLAHEGARFTFAENGRQALDRLEEAGVSAFDVVLMDIQMPEMDGYEATHRPLEIAPGLPVIGLTAHAMEEERQRCLAAGMVAHVTKPIDPEVLVAAILDQVGEGPSAPPVRVSPAAPAVGATATRIDWPKLHERYAGRAAFIDKLLARARESLADLPVKLRQATQSNDAPSMAFLAHTVKGLAGNLAAHGLMERAAHAEDAARAGQDHAAELARELADDFDGLRAELENRAAPGTETSGPA